MNLGKNIFLFILFTIPLLKVSHSQHYRSGMVLSFLDEFDKYDISQEHWEKMFPWGPYTSGQHYNRQDSNHVYQDGYLSLIAKYEKYRGEVFAWDSAGNFAPYYKDFDYTSAMYYSKQQYKYGYFECKFKAPAVQGTNSAFWLYGNESNEIDVFEVVGSGIDHAKMTLHWQDRDPITNAKQSQTKYYPENALDEGFHTMGVLWTEDDVLWYYGDSAIVENGFIEWQRSRHIPDQNLNLILSLEVGTLDGKAKDSSLFPCQFDVDYVTAYQLEPLYRAPRIVNQQFLSFAPGDSIEVHLTDISVDDSLKFYPIGHKLYLMPGEGYEIISNSSFVALDNRDELHVNIGVTNGLDSSATYPLLYSNDGTTGFANQEFQVFRLYPNPVRNQLNIIGTYEELTILNNLGKVVVQIKDPQPQVSLSNLSPGIYITVFKYKNGRTWIGRVEKL